MVFGYVYCLSNPEMPGVFKVDYVAANIIPRDGEYIYETWNDVRLRINTMGVWMTEFVKMENDADIVCDQINCVLLNNHAQMNDNLYAVDVRELVDVFTLSGGPWVDHNRIVADYSDMDCSDMDCSSSESEMSSASASASASDEGSDSDYETPEMARLRYRNDWETALCQEDMGEVADDEDEGAEEDAEEEELVEETESTEERLCCWC